MASSDQSLVDCAIESGRGVIVTIAPSDRPVSFIAQFFSRHDDGFVFRASSLPGGLKPAAIQSGLQATFIFGIPGAAVEFQAGILSFENKPDFRFRCGAPTDIAVSQRRGHFRVPTTSQAPLELFVWKIPPHWVLRDRPKPSMRFRVELIDLSIGGMCLHILPHRLGPETVAVGDRLRVDFTANGDEAMIDAQIVNRSQAREDGSIRVGVCFRINPNSIESRRADSLLNRVIANLQRQNIKLAATTA